MKAEPTITVTYTGSDWSAVNKGRNLFHIKAKFTINDNEEISYEEVDELKYFIGDEETTEKEVKRYVENLFMDIVRRSQILYTQKYRQNES